MSPGSERRVAAASVPGCQHVLQATPCQDASAARDRGDFVILAVSDGHGDAAYPLSDEGARTAVAVGVEALSALASRLVTAAPSPAELDDLLRTLKRNVAFEWNRRIKYHARMAAERDGTSILWPLGIKGDWDERLKPYGCTLLCVAITPVGAVWFQLGDGDSLFASGNRAERVFGVADKSSGQSTFSLSMRDCVEHMQVRFDEEPHELYLLATDGVGDQYERDPAFEEEWGTSLLNRLRTTGWVECAMRLPRDLGTMARDGDDCSVALAWFPTPAPATTE
ncbi:MAG: PP2C family serine/threonine-protein phosphatase [Myxococcales bacterium]|nr:PP2C family serine/threonine-protein phosphatase [Myxococcales bacterium]